MHPNDWFLLNFEVQTASHWCLSLCPSAVQNLQNKHFCFSEKNLHYKVLKKKILAFFGKRDIHINSFKPESVAWHVAHSIGTGRKWVRARPFIQCLRSASMLGPNRVIAKDVKSCTYCRYVKCTTLIVRVWGMPWTQTGATNYHEQLGLPNKSRPIKGFGCLLFSMAKIYDLLNQSLDKHKVRGLVLCCGQDGNGAQVHPINTYRYISTHFNYVLLVLNYRLCIEPFIVVKLLYNYLCPYVYLSVR